MKLSTMLLPTGEFVFVVSGAQPHSPTGEFLNAFQQFKESAGAAAIFVTNEDIEVENALVDEDAIRHDSIRPGSLTVGDIGFGPVSPTMKPKVGDTVRVIEVAGGNREPYLKYVNLTGRVSEIISPNHPEPLHFVVTELGSIMAQKVELVESVKPKVGDTVRIIGPAEWRHEPVQEPPRDTIGRIAMSWSEPRKGTALVEFEHPDEGEGCRWYFPYSSLEVISNG